MFWRGGIHEGRPVGREPDHQPKAIELERFEAPTLVEAVRVLQAVWRERYREEPPSALLGVEFAS